MSGVTKDTASRRHLHGTILIVLLVMGGALMGLGGADAQRAPSKPLISPGGIEPVSPVHNETLHNNTPLLVVALNESAGPYDRGTVLFLMNGRPVHDLEDDFSIDDQRMAYQVSSLFRLRPGQQNVTVQIETQEGETHRLEYAFFYSNAPPQEGDSGALVKTLLVVLSTLVGLGIMTVVSWIGYLMKVKGWTWRKFVIRYRVPREVLTLYLPITLAVVVALGGLFLRDDVVSSIGRSVSTLPPAVGETLWPTRRFASEYIVLGAVVLGTLPYAIDVHAQRIRRRSYERAYAQFLFEMADAMRGGIDPMKAVLELAKTETGLLREPLKAAADSIRLGRPFDTILENMVKPMNSTLTSRYAKLVGAAAKVGGEISNVVYRAAKDMDDMVKIDGERARAMKTPIMTIYIAFGVLLMMVNTLMDFGPQLAALDITALTSGNLAGGGADGSAPTSGRLTIDQMETRFFHLLMITSIGTGLLIGSFTDGKVRYGLTHMVVMILIGAAFYPTFVL